MTTPAHHRLRRDSRHKMVAGVCAGLARRFGVPRGRMRLLFVISCILPGPQILAYLALWILIPEDDGH
jgi:phage shock protein PspC (stress-responsive transcriptional regulator)